VTLSAGGVQKRVIRLRDLQLQYYCDKCSRATIQSEYNSPKQASVWHSAIIIGLLGTRAFPQEQGSSTRVRRGTALREEQCRIETSDDVVQAFMGLSRDQDDGLKEYLVKQLVRLPCGGDEGLAVMARGVLNDYSWLFTIFSLHSLALAGSHYQSVVAR
jgi:hypothetical protein